MTELRDMIDQLIDMYDLEITKSGYDEAQRLKCERDIFLVELIWNALCAEGK